MYGTLVEANTYHSARLNSGWDVADEVKTAALVRASDYIDGRYRYQSPGGSWLSMFRGTKTAGRSQISEWPRAGATDSEGFEIPDNEVPSEVLRATYELALREVISPGSLAPDFVPSSQVTQETVGPITVKYATEVPSQDGTPPNMPTIPLVDKILAPLLRNRRQAGSALRVV